ncbi:MAG: hypothetical protein LAO23_08025 [Acidobacteriia bacterium]|nr:hypothetical protein [Terriglobia bacterium]
MANPTPANPKLGDLVADGREIFRAFAGKNFRKRKNPPPHEVRYFAYLLRDDDVADGLSVGLAPRDAVKDLAENFGYCSILVSIVHSLPFGLEVRVDAADPTHAFICNLPLMTISDVTREQAVWIARELARKSICITCDPYQPNGPTPPIR